MGCFDAIFHRSSSEMKMIMKSGRNYLSLSSKGYNLPSIIYTSLSVAGPQRSGAFHDIRQEVVLLLKQDLYCELLLNIITLGQMHLNCVIDC